LDGPERLCGMMEDDNYPIKTGSGNLRETKRKNTHPTVKPTDLMRYLCRLVTPPGGTILDPFTGSGSTGKAAMLEGFNFIGCELDATYFDTARRRIEHARTGAGLYATTA
jgi:site-specific DNA-methyltransferase (adenine-specific)